MKKIVIGIVLFLILATLSITQKTASNTSYQAVTYAPVELSNLLKRDKDKYVVIDVRSKVEYDAGHIPGAIHADYYDTEALKKAAGDKIPITYCAFSAMRGPYAAYSLYQQGFKNVGVLAGGISQWAEDIEEMDSSDPRFRTVFNHPKNIFPDRPKTDYPKGRGEVQFNIVATRFKFEPNEIVVEHGQKVTLHIRSDDIVHGIAIPEFGIEEELPPYEEKDITFIADRRGTFPFVCNVICGRAHEHASMVGNLIVK